MSKKANRISPLETATRYIFSERHYVPTTGRIKYPAFWPKNGETSVFRIANLACRQIWNIGNYVASASSRTLRARGDVVASDVFDEGLAIKADTRDHPLHANIIGWPSQRAKIKLLTIRIANKAQLHLKPSKPSMS